MVCILLCAGYATRMYPLTKNFPKPLLPVNGKPLLDYILDDLNQNTDVKQFVIVANHKFVNFFYSWRESRKENIKIIDDGTTDDANRLGAVKDLHLAITKANIEDDIMVLAGDNFLNFSLNEFIEYAKGKSANVIMAYRENDVARLRRTGVVKFDDDHKVIEFEEKPESPKSFFAVPPFYIYKKKNLHQLNKAIDEGCGVDSPGMLLEWFVKRAPTYVWEMKGTRVDIGNINDYQKLEQSFKR